MSNPDIAQFFEAPPVDFRPIVAQILAADVVAVESLTAKKSSGFGGATAGLFYVAGQAQTSAGTQSWTAVVKVLSAAEFARAGIDMNADRELVIYQSGVFAELCGGVRTARCYAIQEWGNLHFVWLEDLSHAPQPPWEPQHFLETARHMGQFNAHWPEDGLPNWAWLGAATFGEKFASPYYEQLFAQLPQRQGDKYVSLAVPEDVAAGLLHLWAEKDMLFTLIDESSKGVCHGDCHPGNLFPMESGTEQAYTIAIDWELAGIGPLGLDVGHLLASPVSHLKLSLAQADALVEPMFDAYLRGLTEAGWTGDADRVRLSYLTRLACESFRKMAIAMDVGENTKFRRAIESGSGMSMEAICQEWAIQARRSLQYAVEARALARKFHA